MAEQTIDLTFLGEQMKNLQMHTRSINAEMTLIREKIVLVEAEQVEMRDNLFQATGELTVRTGKIEQRVAGVELQVGGLSKRVDNLATRVDNLDASNTARFEQIQQTATINMQVLLSAITGLDKKLDAFNPSP
jgi:chaperonin cofactor prefoldin